MHVPWSSENRIDRAYVQTPGAAYTELLIDERNSRQRRQADRLVQCFGFAAEQPRQCPDGIVAAGGATIDWYTIIHDCSRVRPAAGVGALGTLGLWQQRIDTIDQLISVGGQSPGCEHQRCTDHSGETRQCNNSRNHRRLTGGRCGQKREVAGIGIV